MSTGRVIVVHHTTQTSGLIDELAMLGGSFRVLRNHLSVFVQVDQERPEADVLLLNEYQQ